MTNLKTFFCDGCVALLAVGICLISNIANGQCSPGGCQTGHCPTSSMPIMQDWYRPPADQRIDPAPLPTRITPQQPSPAVVQINSQRGDTGLQGTGTIVSLDNGVATIVSCAHILKAGYSVLILFSDGTSSSAEIVSTDAMFDTSVLRAKAPATARLMHIANPPAIGDSIGWCGHAGTGYTSGNAKVLGYDGDLLVITGNVPEGTSGGPIYTPMGIVGILSECQQLQQPGSPWKTFGACSVVIRSMVAKVLQNQNSVDSAKPASMVPVAPIAASETTEPDHLPSASPKTTTQPVAYDDRPVKLAIEELKHEISERAKEKPILEKLDSIRKRIDKHDTDLQDVPVAFDRIKAAEQKISAIPGMDKVRDVAISVVAEQGPTIVAAAEPLFKTGVTAGLTALGISCPVAGVGAMLALALAKRGAQKIGDKIAADRVTNQQMPTGSMATEYRQTQSTPSKDPIIVQQSSPPLPQQLVRDTEYVNVEVPTKRQRAIELAHQAYVQKYPGGRSTVEMIDSLARQIESGL